MKKIPPNVVKHLGGSFAIRVVLITKKWYTVSILGNYVIEETYATLSAKFMDGVRPQLFD